MESIKTRLKIFLGVFAVLIICGTLGFMMIEGKSPIDSLYFVIVTMATVGYGDVHPVTEAGKIFTMVFIVLGVGTFLGVIANATEIMLARREIESRMEKLNMVIGVFFSEIGLHLLTSLSSYDPGFEELQMELTAADSWKRENFNDISKHFQSYHCEIDRDRVDFQFLQTLLCDHRGFLVNLLENPNLMEHQTFTDLLRAVFHLMEELAYREDTQNLAPADRSHLAADSKRVFRLLIREWMDYVLYLKNNYPYLFSLSMRTNPFDKTAKVVISED